MKYLSNIDLAKNQLQNAVIHPLASAPATPTQGQMYFNTTDKKLYFYDNSTWVDCSAVDFSTVVLKAAYNGTYTVLAADAASTPLAVTLAASTVLGRGPTGGIVALTIDNDMAGGVSANDDTLASAKTIKAYADTKQSALTFGIADTNTVRINGTGTANGDFAKFTASGIIGRTPANVLTDIGAMPLAYLSTSTALGSSDVLVPSQNAVKVYADTKQAALTFGIANTNALRVTDASVTAGDYAMFSATGIDGKTKAEVITDLAVIPTSYLDTDIALAANSDVKIATQKATKAYIDGNIAAANAMVYKGVLDCSANPNYPAADAGWTYIISVAGLIGGGAGVAVDAGDMIICKTDATSSGTQAGVGTAWNIVERNLAGAVTGPTSVGLDGYIAVFNGTTGKIIKDGGVTIASLQGQNANHTGDVTGATALTIAAGAVTLAKMANLAANSIIGNNTGSAAVPLALSGAQVKAMLGLVKADVGLTNVTDDVQTKHAIVPNTLPTAGQILVGNAGGTAYAPVSMGTDATMTSAGAVTIAAGAVTLAKMANLAANSIIGNNTGGATVPVALSVAQVQTMLNVADGATKNVKYARDITETTATTVITHNLNTRDLNVVVQEAATPWARVMVDYELTTVNTLTLFFAVGPAASQYRIIVQAM